ncbi:MAG: 4Fe-4S binding protein [bacterium]
MKESTRKIFAMHGARPDRAVHNYIYFKWYDKYVKYFLKAGRLVRDRLTWFSPLGRLFRAVFNRYHAKVITDSDARKILSLQKPLDVGEASEQVIPFPYAKRIIFSEPDYIAVMDCPCRLSREDPCLPLNVCIAIGETAAGFWLEHGARYHARRVSQEEALSIIRDARQKGCITTAWFKVATGGKTGVLCSCCSCCCGGLEGMRIARSVKGGAELSNIVASGYAVEFSPELCENCGECAEVCMFEAISMDRYGRPEYNRENCMGCGLCVEKCRQGARSLDLDGVKGLPLDIELLQKG